MKLPFRKRQGEAVSNPIIPEMNGPQPSERAGGVRSWVGIAAVTIVAIIVLWLLFLGASWVWHKVTNHSSSPSHVATGTAGDNNTAPSGSGKGNGSGSKAQSSGSGSSSTGTKQSGVTGTSGTGAPSAAKGQNTTLANTGPGSAAAIFGVATAAGVVAYQVRLRRSKS